MRPQEASKPKPRGCPPTVGTHRKRAKKAPTREEKNRGPAVVRVALYQMQCLTNVPARLLRDHAFF
jgi:hypothetical protein